MDYKNILMQEIGLRAHTRARRRARAHAHTHTLPACFDKIKLQLKMNNESAQKIEACTKTTHR